MMHALDPSIEHDLLVTRTPTPRTQGSVFGMISRVIYLGREPLSVRQHELRLLWWLFRNLSRYQVVHVRTHADWYFLGYALAKLMGCRLVLSATLDDSVPGLVSLYRPSRRRAVLRLFRMFDVFVSISPKLHKETASVMPMDRCRMIECGIHLPPSDRTRGLQMRERLGIPSDASVLIFVGGICERKDPMLLVRQHPALLERHPDCFLLLLGPELEPDYVRDLRNLVGRSGLGHRVLFLGQVDDPHPYFEAADIITFASRNEGFGMVVPEAMGHGLPAVARHLPGVNDRFVLHGETGFLFTDDAGYQEGVLRLLDDPSLRRQMGHAGQALVRAQYDLGQVSRAYLAAYGLGQEPKSADPPVSSTLSEIASPLRTASVTDQRFHAPVAQDQKEKPRLIVLADAEEAFDWGSPFSRKAIDVTSMGSQVLAHRIFERYGIIPAYLADYPVVAHASGRGPLLELMQARLCDVGAQLHPWVSPPHVEQVSSWNSFTGNLPLELQFEKIRLLTESIGDTFGAHPGIFRAGRYGAGPRLAELLQRLGYEADSSVMPHWDFSAEGGPDYSAFDPRPCWIDNERRLLEIPCSVGLIGRLSGISPHAWRPLFHSWSMRARLPGIAARLGLLERIRLTPEGTSVQEAQRLIRTMINAGHRTFVVSYHTPSLQPGNTPYVRTGEDLARFLGWLDEIFDFFRTEIGGEFSTWRDVRARALAVSEAEQLMSPSLETA